jgi:hypothetical protein
LKAPAGLERARISAAEGMLSLFLAVTKGKMLRLALQLHGMVLVDPAWQQHWQQQLQQQ